MSEFIQTILTFLNDLGYFGIALGLMIEIIPSEIVLSYGGYMISQGHIGFTGAVIAGTIGGLFSQLFLYWAGRYGGRPFLLKYGKYVFINEKHIDMAENWFQKYGAGVVFFARFIPIVRHAISIPAGISKMSVWKFSIYTIIAVIPWSILFLNLGYHLGGNWQDIKEVAAPYTTPLLLGVLAIGVLFVVKKVVGKRNTSKEKQKA